MRSTLLLILALVSFGSAAFAREFYVATDGRDANPGTFAKPFATLERARDEVRRVKDKALDEGRVTVYVRGGKYLRRKTFELTERDSGREAAPIIYRAYPGEQVHLIGGHVLKPESFTPVTANDPAWKRLDAAAQGPMPQDRSGGGRDHGIWRCAPNGTELQRRSDAAGAMAQ